MKVKHQAILFGVALFLTWVGYCTGYHIAFVASEKRKARIAYASASIMLSAAEYVRAVDYAGAVDKLLEASEFYIFYVETAKLDASAKNLIRSFVRPDIEIGNSLLDIDESFIQDDKLDFLKNSLSQVKAEMGK
jgi:hypothetical protein